MNKKDVVAVVLGGPSSEAEVSRRTGAAIAEALREKGYNAVEVELVPEKLVDKLIQFTAPKILADNEGKSFAQGFDIKDINNSLYLKLIELKKFDEDIMCEYKILY